MANYELKSNYYEYDTNPPKLSNGTQTLLHNIESSLKEKGNEDVNMRNVEYSILNAIESMQVKFEIFATNTLDNETLVKEYREYFEKELLRISETITPALSLKEIIDDILNEFEISDKLQNIENRHFSSQFEALKTSNEDQSNLGDIVNDIQRFMQFINPMIEDSAPLPKEITDAIRAFIEYFTPNAIQEVHYLIPVMKKEKDFLTNNNSLYNLFKKSVLKDPGNVDQLQEFLDAFKDVDPNLNTELLKPAKQKATILDALYEINAAHEGPDETRFTPIQNYTSDELFDLITLGREEIFTSSYLYVFKLFLKRLKSENKEITNLLDKDTENTIIFLEAAAAFDKINELLRIIPENKKADFFIKILDKTLNSDEFAIKNLVGFLEIILKITNTKLVTNIARHIKEKYDESENLKNKTTLGIMLSELKKTKTNEYLNSLKLDKKFEISAKRILKSPDIFNENGENIQQMFFYNDDDGKTSFNSFKNTYRKDKRFKIIDHEKFIIIVGTDEKSKKTIKIYANKPQYDTEYYNEKNEDDLSGPDEIMEIFEKSGISPSFLIHRGHSYYAEKTLGYLNDDAKAVWLGSCNGAENTETVAQYSPEAQIIATKSVGTKYVNDTLFKTINDDILAGKDLNWEDIWKRVGEQKSGHPKYNKIKDDPRFASYQRPDQNMPLQFIKKLQELMKDEDEEQTE